MTLFLKSSDSKSSPCALHLRVSHMMTRIGEQVSGKAYKLNQSYKSVEYIIFSVIIKTWRQNTLPETISSAAQAAEHDVLLVKTTSFCC